VCGPEPVTSGKRKCKLRAIAPEHISRNGKCPTYPNGKTGGTTSDKHHTSRTVNPASAGCDAAVWKNGEAAYNVAAEVAPKMTWASGRTPKALGHAVFTAAAATGRKIGFPEIARPNTNEP